jgi:hypothetical protein
MKAIQQKNGARQVPWKFVLWLDDDMVASPSHVAFMRDACGSVGQAVSALYCKRGNSRVLTIKEYLDREPLDVEMFVDGARRVDFISYPVTAGMGCLMVPVEIFEKHCASVPQFKQLTVDGLEPIPGICASGMSADVNGNLGWMSEDQCYCESLWHWAGGVWTVPIVFSHLSEVPLVPIANAEWLMNAQSAIPAVP